MASKSPAEREQWSGQLGFLMSAIGSAIGLGNIWRFPGVAYTNGGGAFLIPYVVALLTAGIPILLLDYSLGHRFRGSAPAVFRRVKKKFEFLGWFQVGICFVIGTYYAVVLAWAVSYIWFSLSLAWGSDPQTFFLADYLSVSDPGFTTAVDFKVFVPLVIMWVAVLVCLALGVRRGLEWANKVAIPALVVMFLVLVVRAVTLPGAADGLNALFTPDWAALADPGVWIAAYGQIFFSLSIAFGIMMTYSSYLRTRSNLVPTGYVAAFANSSFEILAGIGVFATLGFMASQQGVGVGDLKGISGVILSFVTFPQVISMMPGGAFFGVMFFGSLTLAGFTSLISVLQVTSAAFQEKFGISTVRATVIIVIIEGILSVLLFGTTNGLNALDVVDAFNNNVGIVSSAILTCLFVAVITRKLPELQAHLNQTSTVKVGWYWRLMVSVVTPIMLVVMLVMSIKDLFVSGYDPDSYPRSFEVTFGWGTIVFLALFTVVFTALRWRTNVGDFTPVPIDRAQARVKGASS